MLSQHILKNWLIRPQLRSSVLFVIIPWGRKWRDTCILFGFQWLTPFPCGQRSCGWYIFLNYRQDSVLLRTPFTKITQILGYSTHFWSPFPNRSHAFVSYICHVPQLLEITVPIHSWVHYFCPVFLGLHAHSCLHSQITYSSACKNRLDPSLVIDVTATETNPLTLNQYNLNRKFRTSILGGHS